MTTRLEKKHEAFQFKIDNEMAITLDFSETEEIDIGTIFQSIDNMAQMI